MNKQTLLVLILSVALAVSLTVNVVLGILWPSSSDGEQHPSTEPEIVTSDPNKSMMEITTPYGTLGYPEEYADTLFHEGYEENGVYTHTFFMRHGEDKVELFAICFGDETVGTPIGFVGEIAVNVTSTALMTDDSWTEADEELFGNMQMAVNDVIASLHTWDHFVG